jgi:hypothetical protein
MENPRTKLLLVCMDANLGHAFVLDENLVRGKP